MSENNQHKYKAFMSYSHAADGKLAPALQSALHRFTKPWYRLRAMRVFRDKTSLAMTPELWPSIEKALVESEYFLLLASPLAAQSEWVQQEVEWWLQHRSPNTLFIVLTDGEVFWDRSTGDFFWTRTTALPTILQARFKNEPLYIDLRWARSEENLSLRSPQFRAAVLDVASPLLGRSKDELDGEDIRQHRMTKTVTGIAIAAIVALAIAAAWQAYAATQQKKEAEHQRTIAQLKQQEAEVQRDRAELQRKKTLDLITWVTNQTASFDIDRWDFSEDTTDLLSGLGSRLSDAGFKGKVIIEGRVAPYCVVYDNKNQQRVHLAPDDLPIAKCEFYPTIAAYNLVIGEKRARVLQRLLQSLQLPEIEFQVTSYGRVEPFGDGHEEIRTAKDWNRRAKRSNKLHIVLSENKRDT